MQILQNDIQSADRHSALQIVAQRALKISGTIPRLRNMPEAWRIASTCTGTGTFETAFHWVANSLSSMCPEMVILKHLAWRIISCVGRDAWIHFAHCTFSSAIVSQNEADTHSHVIIGQGRVWLLAMSVNLISDIWWYVICDIWYMIIWWYDIWFI